ncbi:mitochondrial phosphate carrier protein 1, mitochondrial isoform X2 [Sorghum bicolor]|uniref:mitochondrial phosphate carrier protein 1, mitochondrial isoform X2 n=1 Tax=Sorghum bicolor TaxID=4558 RepID=UPI000B425EC4|nr:mitochondrial phosphate carrier protein 1, mitochondrial isoform X2 [Sorghum bicolor]|eukprot:XP_021309584.1 mitochondrial phosphate carrier protein 1, mitochondrial isoform X2 [Sorghum bicolor]
MGDAEAASRVGRRGAAAAAGMRVFSPEYYALCAGGGMLAAGATHLAITPLDVLKVNMQVNPMKYNSIFSGLNVLVKEEGPSSLWRGWGGKFVGYGVQGGCRFGLYEYFKKRLSPCLQKVWLMAFQGCMQLKACLAFTGGFYLFGDGTFHKVIQKKKEDCSTIQQLGATCVAGYISGAVGTVVSNPADNIVSSLYNKKAENIIHAVKSIGFRNLFTRSLPIRIALVGPVISMQWFFYDTIKILTGLPPSGGLPRELEEVNI